ncbi:hypothetical protein PoB_003898900 [Plakobranchus ocellatus]|uniref:Uncharacterized protein n=1 Tax=Plakobranchus ocellatus TaxID=259542 RepID=A0AAV4AXH9_9GAST|nr:hypothetical protein PoB_003898900 [Plakobranchus ocellatus]
MELRSGTKVHLSRDYFPANAYRDPYNLYTPLKRPQRIKREAKALNLLNVIGEVREGLRQPEAITHTCLACRHKRLFPAGFSFCNVTAQVASGQSRLLGHPLVQDTGSWVRNRDRKVRVELRANSLSSMPPLVIILA